MFFGRMLAALGMMLTACAAQAADLPGRIVMNEPIQTNFPCADPGVLRHIADRFAWAERTNWHRGYVIAALGPLLVGVLYEATGGWTAPIGFLLAALTVQTGARIALRQHVRVSAKTFPKRIVNLHRPIAVAADDLNLAVEQDVQMRAHARHFHRVLDCRECRPVKDLA